jgi:hypothetical protein
MSCPDRATGTGRIGQDRYRPIGDLNVPTADPTTTLDPNFSSPTATPTPWSDGRQRLEQAELFWLTTVRPNGPMTAFDPMRRTSTRCSAGLQPA